MNRRLQKTLNQMIVTLVGAGVFLVVVIPWFTGRMEEVAKRPLIRMQQQQEAQRLEIERKAQAERALMGNVHKLVRESKTETASKPLPAVVVEDRRRDEAYLGEMAQKAQFDEAWRRWYKKSPECAGGNSIECGNDFIRKRREFQRLYAAGKVN